MAANPPSDAIADDFFEQILSMPIYAPAAEGSAASAAGGGGVGSFLPPVFPLGLSLDQSCGASEDVDLKAQMKRERDSVPLSLSPMLRQIQSQQMIPNPTQIFQGQVSQEAVAAPAQLPATRPKVRARRGQATDPHSIAERLRRERITERFRALQELLPNINKTDRAVMLDEVVDYVKFLRLQVKILSMSRIGGTGAMAQIVADIPFPSLEGEVAEGGSKQHFWEKWTDDGTEHQVAKLMEEDIGAALQVLQSKALCIMPISLASTIYRPNYKVEDAKVEPDETAPS